MSSPIPAFYRIWFTTIDPILSLVGVVTHLFARTAALTSYAVAPVSPPATETAVLLDAMAGFFAGLTLLQVVLLRARPADVTVWRALQAATALVDIGMLGGFARALSATGRMNMEVWRPEEWTNVGITAWVAVLRTAFCLGTGMSKDKTA